MANQPDPESCTLRREVQGEALTGETDGPAIEPRNQERRCCYAKQKAMRSMALYASHALVPRGWRWDLKVYVKQPGGTRACISLHCCTTSHRSYPCGQWIFQLPHGAGKPDTHWRF